MSPPVWTQESTGNPRASGWWGGQLQDRLQDFGVDVLAGSVRAYVFQPRILPTRITCPQNLWSL